MLSLQRFAHKEKPLTRESLKLNIHMVATVAKVLSISRKSTRNQMETRGKILKRQKGNSVRPYRQRRRNRLYLDDPCNLMETGLNALGGFQFMKRTKTTHLSGGVSWFEGTTFELSRSLKLSSTSFF